MAALCALVTVFFAGYSGGQAGQGVSPKDSFEGGPWAGSILVALVAFLPAIACVAAARPTRFIFRLLTMSVATWLIVGLGIVIDDNGRLSWLLLAVSECVTLFVFVHAIRHARGRPASRGASGSLEATPRCGDRLRPPHARLRSKR